MKDQGNAVQYLMEPNRIIENNIYKSINAFSTDGYSINVSNIFLNIFSQNISKNISENFVVPDFFMLTNVTEKDLLSQEFYMAMIAVGSMEYLIKSPFSKGRMIFENKPFKIKIKEENSFEICGTWKGLDRIIPVTGKELLNFNYIIQNYNIYNGLVDGEFFFATQKGKIKLIDNYLLDLSIVEEIII